MEIHLITACIFKKIKTLTEARETIEKSVQARSLGIQDIQPTENTSTIFDPPTYAGILASKGQALGQNLT